MNPAVYATNRIRPQSRQPNPVRGEPVEPQWAATNSRPRYPHSHRPIALMVQLCYYQYMHTIGLANSLTLAANDGTRLAQVSQKCANWLILCTSRLKTSHLLSLQPMPSSFGTLQNVTECDSFAYLTHFQRLLSPDELSKSRSAEDERYIDRPSNSAATARQPFFRLLQGPGRVLSAAQGAMSRWPDLAAFGRLRNVGHRLPDWKWPVSAAGAGSPLTGW